MQKAIHQLIEDEWGAAALEYSLVVAALAIGVLAAISSLSDTLIFLYQTITSGLGAILGFLAD